jgi:cell division protein FtsB
MEKKRGGLFILVLGLVVAVRLGSNVVKLYKSGGRLTEQEAKLVEVKKENKELKARLAQVQSSEFMEREAREKLGLGKEGEVVVIIPEKETESVKNKTQTQDDEPHWVKWRKLYLKF